MEIKRLKRRIDTLYSAIQFSSFASSFVIFLYITVILQEKRFSNTKIGLTLALGSGLSIVLPPLIAAFYARHPHFPLRRVVASVRLVTLVFSVLLMVVHSPVALVSLIVVVISATTITGTSMVNALGMQFEKAGVPVNYGVARAFGSMGCAAMAYASGLLATYLGGSNAVIGASVLLVAVTGVCTLLFPVPERCVEAAKHTTAPPPVSGAIGFHLLKSPANLLFFGVMVLIWANMGVLDTYQVNILHSVGGGDMDFALMLAVMCMSEVPLALFFRPLTKRFSYVHLMTLGFAVLLLKDVALIFASSVPAVIIAQVCNLSTVGMFASASVYYCNGIVCREDTVQAQALFTGTAMAMGRILGNSLGGVILDHASITVLLLVCVGYALLSISLLQVSHRLRKKSAQTALAEAVL
jgi:PPP family 3-phenylpropionic acid transporter